MVRGSLGSAYLVSVGLQPLARGAAGCSLSCAGLQPPMHRVAACGSLRGAYLTTSARAAPGSAMEPWSVAHAASAARL